jgi:hypothetical protein
LTIFRAILLTFALLACKTCWAMGPEDSIVILYVEFGDGTYEIGTGAFVDHDGLILTADHVVHQSTVHPPSTFAQGSVPIQIQPTKITAYSALLGTAVPVNLQATGSVVGGNLSSSQWVDAALVRATLTPIQRASIQPLDLAIDPPGRQEQLTAWGPHCINVQDRRCLVPESVGVTLSSSASLNRDYEIRANLKIGYSGGPLTNAANSIVGIASWGDKPDGSGSNATQIFNATYIKSAYIAYFFQSRVVPSEWFQGTNGCNNTRSLPYLTLLDMKELFPVSNQRPLTAEQCVCCCQSIPRAPNALNTGIPFASCQQQPIDCLQAAVFPLANSIQVAAATQTVDATTVAEYLQLRKIFTSISTANLPADRQERLYDALGLTSTVIASQYLSQSPAFATAPTDALTAYKLRSKLGETPEMYFNASTVLSGEGKSDQALNANLMGTLVGTRQATVDPATNHLRNQIFANVPDRLVGNHSETTPR